MVGAQLDNSFLERIVAWRSTQYRHIRNGVDKLREGNKIVRDGDSSDTQDQFDVMAELVAGYQSVPYVKGRDYPFEQFIGPVEREEENEKVGPVREKGEHAKNSRKRVTFWIPYRINRGKNQFGPQRVLERTIYDKARREMESIYVYFGAKLLLLGFLLQGVGYFT